MRNIDIKTLSLSGVMLALWFFSTGATAGCLENGYDSEVVTEYGGSTLSCPNNHQGCSITDIISGESCVITNPPDAENEPPTYTSIVINVPNGDYVEWNAYVSDEFGNLILDTDGNPVPDTDHPIDNIITDTATGANGCFQAFGTDQVSGIAGFQRDNGSYLSTKAASFCTDNNPEVTASAPPPPAEVEECVLASGTSKIIHGVTFSCPEVPDGETRTIVVSKDTTCTDTDMDGLLECSSVPDFGFTTNGDIDFNNVCQCVGANVATGMPSPTTEVIQTECDPDPENPTCVIGDDARVPVEILFQNPKCFTIGGVRKCF